MADQFQQFSVKINDWKPGQTTSVRSIQLSSAILHKIGGIVADEIRKVTKAEFSSNFEILPILADVKISVSGMVGFTPTPVSVTEVGYVEEKTDDHKN